jgi:Zn-dependent membrane protease YugP
MLLAAAAFLAYGRYSWLLKHYQNFETRRTITGCEIARQVLDLKGYSQRGVRRDTPGEEGGRTGQELLLEETDYEGTSLLAAAAAARHAVILTKLSDPWMLSSTHRLRRFLDALILPAWVFLGLGSVSSDWEFLRTAGFSVLGGVIFTGIIDFARDVELKRETLELLKKTGCFEPDEISKLKRLLSALQLEGLAAIFKVPHEFIASRTAKRKSRFV